MAKDVGVRRTAEGGRAVRRRPILLAGAALAAGLVLFQTVGAQSPTGSGANQPKVYPVAVPPVPPARPAGEWGATTPGYPAPQPPANPVRPAGAGYLPPPTGQQGTSPAGNRPRLTNPVVAGPDGVRPAGFELPPPNMDAPPVRPAGGLPLPAGALPPPSITIDPSNNDSKFPPAAATVPPTIPVPPSGGVPAPPGLPLAPAAPPLTPPPASSPAVPPLPVPPAVAGTGNVGVAPIPVVTPGVGSDTGLSPGSTPVRPSIVGAGGALPGRAIQNVTIEAVCPETIGFGQEFRYELIVRNAGTSPLVGVRIEDELPVGVKYIGSDPPAELQGDRLTWGIGQLEAGGEKRVVVRVKPAEEGEVRSRATVTYTSAVDARTRVTRPRIAVAITGAELCRAGEDTVFQIKVSNVGSGPASRMILHAQLTEGLVHAQGSRIEAELANLGAGESKTIPLKVNAAKAGAQWCQIAVSVEGCPDATAKATVNVVEPMLQVTQTGPARCLVRSEPVYEITLANPGTAATDPITVYSVLPEGFEYIQASEGGSFSTTNRAVVWKLPGLAPGSSRAVSLKVRAGVATDGVLRTIAQAMPEQPATGTVAAGGLAVRTAGRALEAKTETAIKAEGVAAVRFEVIDLEDPVEVGKEAVYEIRVTNQGTGVCTNVQLVAAMAEGTAYAGASGPTQVRAQGQHIVFDPIPTLGVKGEAIYRVRVKGTTAGEARFRVQLTSDQVRTPVVKEESTRFYKE